MKARRILIFYGETSSRTGYYGEACKYDRHKVLTVKYAKDASQKCNLLSAPWHHIDGVEGFVTPAVPKRLLYSPFTRIMTTLAV